jgi:hypothetical protein
VSPEEMATKVVSPTTHKNSEEMDSINKMKI